MLGHIFAESVLIRTARFFSMPEAEIKNQLTFLITTFREHRQTVELLLVVFQELFQQVCLLALDEDSGCCWLTVPGKSQMPPEMHKSVARDLFVALLPTEVEHFKAEDLALALILRNCYVQWGKNPPPILNNLLSSKNLKKMAPMFESTASAYPRLHSVHNLILKRFFPENPDAKAAQDDAADWKAFIKHILHGECWLTAARFFPH